MARRTIAALTAALLVCTLVAAAPTGAVPACGDGMGSTFLQPSYSVFAWDAARYDTELQRMKDVGITTVIAQWTVDMDANLSHYPGPATWYPRGPDTITPLINTAASKHMSVWLGLGNVYNWQAHATDYDWLYNQMYVNMVTADQLYALYPGRIKGWYISNEVDDKLLANPAAVAAMTWFFTGLTNYLHTHNGNLPVMASPTYAGLRLSPAQFARGVKQVHGALDVVNVQDGGGSGYIGASNITDWFRALSAAFKGSKTAVWQNADMFMTPRGPMSPAQLQANLNATCGYVTARSGFSFSTQMSPESLGTPFYFDSYRAWVRPR